MGHGEEVSEQLNSASMDCLPDDLLVQILSFLPTKQAASTSLLSKRWRTLFTFNHSLDYSIVLQYPEYGKSYGLDIQKSFEDFVDKTLAFQGGNHLKKFSLKFKEFWLSKEVNKIVVDRWICNALEHSLSELHLRLEYHGMYPNLPSKIFTSTTLVKLSLGTGLLIPSVPSDISLPALKVLLLDSVDFEGDQLSDVFLAACPALEELSIYQTCYPNVISSKTIKKLSVTYRVCWYVYSSSIILLDTPSVVDLYFSDFPRQKSPHCNLNSLAKATLDLHFPDYIQWGPFDGDVTHYFFNMIRNVKTLHLTFPAVEVISVYCKGGLPVFNNLVELVFSSNKRGWKVLLPLLLEQSPNLKTLILSGLDRYTFRERRFVGIRIPSNNQIKTLHIRQYQGNVTELKHISHILLNMELLELVKVYVAATMDDPKKMQLTEDLLKLPTASSKLEIQFIITGTTLMTISLRHLLPKGENLEDTS